MLKPCVVVVLLLITIQSYGQEYMDKITAASCKCLEDLKGKEVTEGYVEQVGLCMIAASQPYQKELKNDFNIDFENIDVEGERLGRIIGMKMTGVCPAALMDISKKINESKAAGKKPGPTLESFSGKITQLESDQFIVLHVKDDAGKVNKFVWLDFVESSVDADKFSTLIGKSVEVKFTSSEFFDPKIKEYRKFSVLKKLDVK